MTEEENKRQAALQTWLKETASAKIKAAVEDASLLFIERDAGDDEQLGSLDHTAADYDPIIDVGTGSRFLSQEIKHAAAMFRISEKRLKVLLNASLRKIWADHPKTIPSEPIGKSYGRSFLVSRHGVWFRQAVAGLDTLYVWRRIAKTRIDPEALSYDTTPQENWRHCYLITGENGRVFVDIDEEHLGGKANRAINRLMRHGVHIVESKQARQELPKFLRHRPSKRIIRAPRTGWFECRGHSVFVLPDAVLGADKVARPRQDADHS